MKTIPALNPVSRGTAAARVVLALLPALLAGPLVQAAPLTWDGGDAAAGGTTGGSGTWDANSTVNWTGGAGEQAWTDTTGVDAAVFAGTAGTVTVSGTVTANLLQFGANGYVLSGGTINLAGASPSISFGSTNSATINSAITGSDLSITGSANGVLVLNGDNAGITGTTTLSVSGGGTMVVGLNPTAAVDGATNNGFGSSTLRFAGGTVQLNYRDSQGGTYGNAVDIDGGNVNFNIARPSSGSSSTNRTLTFGTLTYNTANTVTLSGLTNGYKAAFSDVSLAADGTLLFSGLSVSSIVGAISETVAGRSFTVGASSTVFTGTTLVLTGESTYTGATNIRSGTLRTAVANALPSVTTVTIGAAGYSGSLDLYGNDQTVAGLTATGTLANQTVTNGAAGTGTATLTVNGAGDSTFGGVIKNGATAKVALTKSGAGVFTLSGVNTYTGATTLTEGTLALGASDVIADASALVLSGGVFATQGFSDTLGTLALNGPASIDFGDGASSLAFADSSALEWTGTLTLLNFDIGTDSLRFGVVGTALTADELSRIALAGYTAGLDADGYVTFTAVPEPAAWAALLGSLALAAAVGRKRRRAHA